MDAVWVVLVETYNDGQLEHVEPVIYASEQTARQHANRDGSDVLRVPVLTKLREY